VFVIAHIRGGEELGRAWYEAGKMAHKMNTFTDFIACGESLIEEGWVAPDQLSAMGGSAGGLLMGAVMNLRPELWHSIVAQVPFVDVVTTMLDTSIPLTTGEFDEWGNPAEPEAFHRMYAYSPYDQVKKATYPHLLVTTGYHDSQVQYWEPAKWVAKLREHHAGHQRLLFLTDMEAGHGGKTGRYQRFREIAKIYTFLLSF
jgi:oligopeptidase B